MALAVARALYVFALLSAFLVVAVRCLSGFPSGISGVTAGFNGSRTVTACPSSGAPQDSEALACADSDDDADDATDALIATLPVHLVPLASGNFEGVGCGVAVAERALPSHAQGLERPPRA